MGSGVLGWSRGVRVTYSPRERRDSGDPERRTRLSRASRTLTSAPGERKHRASALTERQNRSVKAPVLFSAEGLRYVAAMADIRVERRHTIGKEAALAAALRVAERMREKAQVQFRVNGDTIEFDRSGAKGRIVVGDQTVLVEATLGLLLKPMRGFIEQKIDDYFGRFFQ